MDHVAWPIPSISGAHAHYAYNSTPHAYLCVCVCVSTTILGLQVTRRLMSVPTASVLQGQENQCGDFAETTAFERYGVKTS